MGAVEERTGEHSSLRAWAGSVWPEADWADADVVHGAFHLVAIPREGPLFRATIGGDHAARMDREASILKVWESVSLSLPVPRDLSGAVSETGRSGVVISRVPGGPGRQRSWDAPLMRTFDDLLNELRSIDVDLVRALPPPRSWCGGPRWPEIVRRDLGPLLDSDVREGAYQAVSDVILFEADVEPTLCHGDFGAHNLLWQGDEASGLFDLDHACVGDPAIDVAPLVGFYGANAVETMTGTALVDRAMVHRATLSLQVAAAAQIAGRTDLRDHALGNFTNRWRSGTAYDPGGRTPAAATRNPGSR